MKYYLSLQRFLESKYQAFQSKRLYENARLRQTNQLTENPDLSGSTLIFVTGFDKSGTTWLMQLLNDHPQIVCRGSGQFFNYYQEGIHYLANPGGYRALTSMILQNPWYKGSGKVWVTDQGVHETVRNIILHSMLAFSNGKETVFIGDKSTVQDCFLIRKLFPESHIVAIVRDGRDVAVSFAYHFKRRGKPDKFAADGRLEETYLVNVAQGWSLYNDHISKFASSGDKKFNLLKYESLLSDAEPLISNLLEKLAVNNEPPIVRSMVSKNSFERLTGGRKPGEEDPNSFFRKGVAQDWKNHLSPLEVKTFGSYAGKVLNTFGYEFSNS